MPVEEGYIKQGKTVVRRRAVSGDREAQRLLATGAAQRAVASKIVAQRTAERQYSLSEKSRTATITWDQIRRIVPNVDPAAIDALIAAGGTVSIDPNLDPYQSQGGITNLFTGTPFAKFGSAFWGMSASDRQQLVTHELFHAWATGVGPNQVIERALAGFGAGHLALGTKLQSAPYSEPWASIVPPLANSQLVRPGFSMSEKMAFQVGNPPHSGYSGIFGSPGGALWQNRLPGGQWRTQGFLLNEPGVWGRGNPRPLPTMRGW